MRCFFVVRCRSVAQPRQAISAVGRGPRSPGPRSFFAAAGVAPHPRRAMLMAHPSACRRGQRPRRFRLASTLVAVIRARNALHIRSLVRRRSMARRRIPGGHRHGQQLETRDGRPERHGALRLRRASGRLLRRRGSRRRPRLEDVPRHAVELEGSQLFPTSAGPALYAGQAGGHPGRLRLGHDLQCQRRHGQDGAGRLWGLAVGDLRAAGFAASAGRRT